MAEVHVHDSTIAAHGSGTRARRCLERPMGWGREGRHPLELAAGVDAGPSASVAPVAPGREVA